MKNPQQIARFTMNSWNGERLVPVDVAFRTNEIGIPTNNDIVLDPTSGQELSFKFYCPTCRCLFIQDERTSQPNPTCPNCSQLLMQPWRHVMFERFLDRSFDTAFASCDALTWYPWVGTEYDEHGILIIAESHYCNIQSEKARKMEIELWRKDPWATREVHTEYPLLGSELAGWRNNGGRGNNPTHDNLLRILTGDSLDWTSENLARRVQFWRCMAFMNFIQRPLTFIPTWRERPSCTYAHDDHLPAWEALLHVIATLKPRLCIFTGVEAAKCFGWYMDRFGVANSGLIEQKRDDDPTKKLRINRCNPRSATITVGGSEVALEFLKHPGMFISCQAWRDYLLKRVPWLESEIAAILS